MRFITEFHVDDSDWTNPLVIAETRKTIFGKELGVEIASKLSWESPVNDNPTRFKLEIEAFPMDKWVEFKQKLHDYLHVTGWVSGAIIFKMIEELESYGSK